MNSQDLRALQEAYIDVYAPQELDEAEGSYGQTPKASAAYTALAFGKGKSKTKSLALKHLIRSAGEDNSDKPSPKRSKMTQSDRDYHRGQSENGGEDREGIDFDEFDTGASGPGGKPKGKKLERQIKRGVSAEGYDLYDIILSHLLDEGYAETPEQAEVIMVNMSEEWREGILSEAILEYQPFKDKRKRVKSKVKKLESQKSEDPKDLGFRNARLQKRIDSMKTVLGKKNKEITSTSQQKSYDSMAKGGFKHHDDPQSKYYIK